MIFAEQVKPILFVPVNVTCWNVWHLLTWIAAASMELVEDCLQVLWSLGSSWRDGLSEGGHAQGDWTSRGVITLLLAYVNSDAVHVIELFLRYFRILYIYALFAELACKVTEPPPKKKGAYRPPKKDIYQAEEDVRIAFQSCGCLLIKVCCFEEVSGACFCVLLCLCILETEFACFLILFRTWSQELEDQPFKLGAKINVRLFSTNHEKARRGHRHSWYAIFWGKNGEHISR